MKKIQGNRHQIINVAICRSGNFLFHYRAFIAVPFFTLLVIFSNPTKNFMLSLILILTGLAMRIWAAGYIGPDSRKRRFSSQYVINNGPYKILKHPLYLGNFFLVLGTVLLFNPVMWVAIFLVLVFILDYSLIIASELVYLQSLPRKPGEFKITNCFTEIYTIITMLVIYLIYFGIYRL